MWVLLVFGRMGVKVIRVVLLSGCLDAQKLTVSLWSTCLCQCSKAKRKKKREEAEKLPTVSKEMYYNITTDLKEIFQTTKDNSEQKDMPHVDCEEEKAKEVHVSAAPVTGAEQPSGFTFSFFDSDTKDVKEGIFFSFFTVSF